MRKCYYRELIGVPIETHKREADKYPKEYTDSLIAHYLSHKKYPHICSILWDCFPNIKPPSRYVFDYIIDKHIGKRIKVQQRRTDVFGSSSKIYFTATDKVTDFLRSLPKETTITEVVNAILELYINRYQYEQKMEEERAKRVITYDRFGNEVYRDE